MLLCIYETVILSIHPRIISARIISAKEEYMKRAALYLFISTASLILLLSCGGNVLEFLADTESKEAKRYEITKALDDGDYQSVIDKLTDSSYGFTEEERSLNLAAAHLGLSGFDIPSMVNDMLTASSEAVGLEDPDEILLDKLSDKATGDALLGMEMANDYYEKIYNGVTIGPTCTASDGITPKSECTCDDLKIQYLVLYDSMSNIQKDSCYYAGVLDLVSGFTSIAVVIDDISAWTDPQACVDDVDYDGSADAAEAAGCAQLDAISQGSCTDPGVDERSALVFDDLNDDYNTLPVEVLRITYATDILNCPGSADNIFYKHIYNAPGVIPSPVVTDGYCTQGLVDCNNVDYTSIQNNIDGNDCWPCPVQKVDEPLTYTNTIVEAINTGGDAITTLTGNEAMAESVDDFKIEICGTADCEVTESNLAAYLANSPSL
jgi:hypothetical protein